MSTEDEYTPTTEEVRADHARSLTYPKFVSPIRARQFDRWLACLLEGERARARTEQGSCWDEAPRMIMPPGHCGPEPERCRLPHGHGGAHRAGRTEWMRRGPAVTDAMVERAAKALWVMEHDDDGSGWAQSVVDDVFSPADGWPDDALEVAGRARVILEAGLTTDHTIGDE